MAHFAIAIDGNRPRREAFAARVRTLFADLPDTTTNTAHAGDMTSLWAVGPRAPVSVFQERDAFALLLGYAIDDAGAWLTARDLHDRRLAPAAGACDGYHAAVTFDPSQGLTAAVDPFCLFPLYHASVGGGAGEDGAVVVSSTPEAICAHPLFAPRIDRLGLCGILLVHGTLDDRPLLAGIKRLSTGHRLEWKPGGGGASPREVEAWRLSAEPAPTGESFADASRRLDHELVTAIRRHRPPGDDTAMLLSGGMDSRLVAGVLADEGISTRAIVLGEPGDFEVQAGTAVAARLGMPAEVLSTETNPDDASARVRRAVRFSHLNSAPSLDGFAHGLALARSTRTFFWSGMLLDWVFEPVGINNGRDRHTGEWRFETLVDFMNNWGVRRGQLPSLLGNDGPALVATALDGLHKACLQGPAEPAMQSAMVRWDQRVRNHLATVLHQTTFHSWPLMPAADRRLLAAMMGLPVSVYEDRRLETCILRARRPELASLPLDRNSFQFSPLGTKDPSLLQRAWAKLGRTAQRWYWQRVRGRDPRRYQRVFDIRHPSWVATRRKAEPLRGRLYELLDARELDRLLPGPNTQPTFRNAINEGGPIRLLLGLAFWLDRTEVG
jgi:asparagine synthase (glutamine-hydrolysing)